MTPKSLAMPSEISSLMTFADEIETFVVALRHVLLLTRDPSWAQRLDRASSLIERAIVVDAPILVCGNGGSASDAEHIVAELVGKFVSKDRPPINAICLSSNSALMTAWANDVGYDAIFARQVKAHGRKGGLLICLSTSGNSETVVRAAKAARNLKLPVISLTGSGGGRLAQHSDVLIEVPSIDTAIIQQVHICIYHHLCRRAEASLSSNQAT